MNRERRKRIDEVIEKANEIQAMLQELRDEIEEIQEEEQEYLENIPENLQGSERYETAENAVDSLASAVDWCDSIDYDELISVLEESKGN